MKPAAEGLPDGWHRTWPRIELAQPLSGVRPASYNPRFLSDAAFDRLKDSMSRHGCVKPIIVNGNGVLLAGHQRCKAMTAVGIDTTPAVILPGQVGSDDEVLFNLMHNSVEESGSRAAVPPANVEGFYWVNGRDVIVHSTGKAAPRIGSAAKMLTKHGPWGSVIADHTGEILVNTDYAVACQKLRMPVLVYYATEDHARELAESLGGDYGVYDTRQTQDTPYVQTMLQRYRLRFKKGEPENWRDRKASRTFRSTTWDFVALPRITKTTRVLDFGAGRMDYSRRLQGEGFDVMCYEPFLVHMDDGGHQLGDGRSFDIARIVGQIKALEKRIAVDGLFDVVVLDSVINATSNDQYQSWIFNACAALLKPDGQLCMGTLGMKGVESGNESKTRRMTSSVLKFVDATGRAVSYDDGVLYAVKYHTRETLAEALAEHFDVVEVNSHNSSQLHAVASKPRLDRAATKEALDVEFNMPYPGGYKHGRHEGLVRQILSQHWPESAT